MLVGSVMLGYAYLWEAWGPIYSTNVADRAEFLNSVFGTYAASYWARIALNIVIPQLLWLPVVRRSEILLFLISLGIIVGMWLERYDIVIPSLARDWMPSYWGSYFPTLWDWATLVGSIGLFLTLFFLMLRFLPIVSISEVREIIAAREDSR
jgi:Ni/Fe-hydrogenase subunit HybB-like protein